MFSLFVDLSDWEVLEKLRERQIDFYVEEDDEMPGFFKGMNMKKQLKLLVAVKEKILMRLI